MISSSCLRQRPDLGQGFSSSRPGHLSSQCGMNGLCTVGAWDFVLDTSRQMTRELEMDCLLIILSSFSPPVSVKQSTDSFATVSCLSPYRTHIWTSFGCGCMRLAMVVAASWLQAGRQSPPGVSVLNFRLLLSPHTSAQYRFRLINTSLRANDEPH